MRLLVVTQVVDTKDPALSFFHGWLVEFANRFNHIEVICLYEGSHNLPANVRVHSLGKEQGRKHSLAYVVRFLKLIWRIRHEYDAVFVHMNQEYVLLGGLFWRILDKPAYLWRNHYAGSWRTGVAALFATKVFCTSKYSYTAKYRKTVLMPIGVAIEQFIGRDPVARIPRSILFFGRLSPSKHPDMLIAALGQLKERGIPFQASIIGSPLSEHEEYARSLVERVAELRLEKLVTFAPGVPHAEAHRIYAAHDIYVNVADSGMFDKTLFEAAASGCLVLALSDDFAERAGRELQFVDVGTLADRLESMLTLNSAERVHVTAKLIALARAESLTTLTDRLITEIG